MRRRPGPLRRLVARRPVARCGDDPDVLHRADVVQPALFSTMVALAALWRSLGVEPGAVVGHSQGEIAAAHVAGAFSLEEAARLVALRGRTMLELGGLGGLMTVFAPVDQVEPLLEAWPGRVGVAVLNGPSTVVVSGENAALDELREVCSRMDLRTKDVKSDIAGHGPQTEGEGPTGLCPGEVEPPSGPRPVLLHGDRWPARHHRPGRRLLVSQPAADRAHGSGPVRCSRPGTGSSSRAARTRPGRRDRRDL
ncbi:acyltransferase domain-containing protein [Streptomyces sp. KS_5]|uniref:acyltransferase domain-containing protein n=1 Tax=Streptomyces sp. KS_5 TaxID=1881018 RepID=UPI00352654B7